MRWNLSQNMEDYLETIHLLELKRGNVRVKDIAGEMEITAPSVSGALKNLEKRNLVRHPRYDLIELTPQGSRIAEEVYRRHQVIQDFLSQILGLDPKIAEKDACRIEHNVSPETVESLARFLEEETGKV